MQRLLPAPASEIAFTPSFFTKKELEVTRFSDTDIRRSVVASRQLDQIAISLQPSRKRLRNHPLYEAILTLDDLNKFLERHVFAVWDFMSLLKHLQSTFTCVTAPWLPKPFPECGRLLNEIALAEETDQVDGEYISHFELYRRMMKQSGANCDAIDKFTEALAASGNMASALHSSNVPNGVQQFVNTTFSFIRSGNPHEAAAAFTFGREDLIPTIFTSINQRLEVQFPNELSGLRLYLERHIELDGDSHGPLALRLVSSICGDDLKLWREARLAAFVALEARVALWDDIFEALSGS
jgi:hypothetical protein